MRTICLGRILPAAIVLAATTVLVGHATSSAAEPGSGDAVRLSFDSRSPDAEDEDLRCMNLDSDTTASAASCEPAATASRQRWEWKIVADGFVQLKNVATGLCLDGGGQSGIVYGFSCDAGNANQRFRYHLRGTATRLIGGDSRYACPDIVFGDDKVRMTSENRRCLNDGGLWQVAVLG
ncbi:RICIN domain-containing protein [Nocardia brasiliensis]|uniref:RICIN domain-containing protein n=1 Tax=Nocardia brasiliensis TaxID=37326 RepID=UPI003789CDC7